MVFDPSRLSYEALLDSYFTSRRPEMLTSQPSDSRAHARSAIFFTSEVQKHAAEQVRARWNASGKFKGPLTTEITAATRFYPAEEYHQNYLAKNQAGHSCQELGFVQQ